MTGYDSGQLGIRNKGIFFEIFDLKHKKLSAMKESEVKACWAKEAVHSNSPEQHEMQSNRWVGTRYLNQIFISIFE